MPRQSLVQQMRSVQAACFFRTGIVVAQLVAIVGVRTVFDNQFGAFARRFTAQVGQALLGYQHHHVVLCVVVVGNHGHDTGNRTAFGHRRRNEERQIGIAREITRTADTVHHLRTHDMGRIYVAVNVGFNHGVHTDNAEAADQFGIIGDFLRPQDDFAA